MKKKNIWSIVYLSMYFIGFIGSAAFLTAAKLISTEAFLYTLCSNIGVMLTCLSFVLRR